MSSQLILYCPKSQVILTQILTIHLKMVCSKRSNQLKSIYAKQMKNSSKFKHLFFTKNNTSTFSTTLHRFFKYSFISLNHLITTSRYFIVELMVNTSGTSMRQNRWGGMIMYYVQDWLYATNQLILRRLEIIQLQHIILIFLC